MRERDIIHEKRNFWVYRDRNEYAVYRTGFTHSTRDSAYTKTPVGLSLAIARCNYLGRGGKDGPTESKSTLVRTVRGNVFQDG